MGEIARSLRLGREHVGGHAFEKTLLAHVLEVRLEGERASGKLRGIHVLAAYAETLAKAVPEVIVGNAIGVQASRALLIDHLGDHLASLGIRTDDVEPAVVVVVVEGNNGVLAGEDL